jgi:hypothetical protein
VGSAAGRCVGPLPGGQSRQDRHQRAALRGAVLPNARGSECLFTLFFSDGTPEEAVEAQMATVEQELRAIASLAGAEGRAT